MSTIYLADSQGRQTTYEEPEARRLWNAGAIPSDSLYWREGMADWRPAAEYFNVPPVPPATGGIPPAIPVVRAQRGFVKDPTRQTRLLVGLLWAYLGAAALAALISIILLVTGQAGQVDPDNLTPADIANMAVGLPQMLIVITTGVVFLMWIHRANRNARGLGAQGMTFTPGWSVGWYFIPIANLWKPYQAMKQIWQASADPAAWPTQKPPPLLAAWWTLWLISNFLANASFRLTMRADTGADLMASEIVTLISDLMDIPLCLVAIRLVRQIFRLQSQWAALPLQSECAICRQPMPASEMILVNQKWVCARCKPIAIQQMREGVDGR